MNARRHYRLNLAALTACGLLSLAGCGPDGEGAVPVSGRVTLDGEPLVNLQITFQPLATDESGFGPGSFARTDSDGRFEMRKVWPDAPGAIPGTHRVTMSFDQDPPSKSLILPEAYRRGTAEFVVPAEGTTEANFDLTSEG